MIDLFLWHAFCLNLSCWFWSIVLQYGARLPIHTLNYWTVQSVAHVFLLTLLIVDLWQYCVCCIISNFTCNSVHALYGALPVSCVPVRVKRGALFAHRYTYEPPRCETYAPVSICNDLFDHVFNGVGLASFKSWANVFLGLICSIPFFLLVFFPFSSFCLYVGVMGLGVYTAS